MPASYRFLTHSVQIDVQGVLTVPEVLQAIQGIIQDPQAHQGIDLICDLRDANAEAVVTNKIRPGAEPIARLLPFLTIVSTWWSQQPYNSDSRECIRFTPLTMELMY